MAITTERIRQIQAGLAGQDPNWDRSEPGVTPTPGAAGVPITTPNGAPTDPMQGSPVGLTTGTPGVYMTLAVSTDGAAFRFWAYYAGLGEWFLIDGSGRTSTLPWTQLIPCGPISRIYCEATAITGTDCTPFFGPSDPGAA